VTTWRELGAAAAAVGVPHPLEELNIYESLFALWPTAAHGPGTDVVERVKRYVVKAAREANEHTSWTDPQVDYEDMVTSYVDELLQRPQFRQSMTRFAEIVAPAALSNLLGLVVLKSWAPGVPDFYQGTELVEPTLTDPDNRRLVDFRTRVALLASLADTSPTGAAELLSTWPDGRLKLAVTRSLLRERRDQAALFASDCYEPLATTTEHAVAFLRRSEDCAVLAVVPRLAFGLAGPGRHPIGDEVWGEERILLPVGAPARYRDVLTDRIVHAEAGQVRLGELLAVLPVAALSAAIDS
jgi:(1->4)-alpha-D-glucan 1-alpha-D-glucosylmutase